LLFHTFRILRAVSRSFPLGVFWLYVGLFALALLCMFLMPPATLLIFFLSLAGLLLAVIVAWLLRTTERSMARALLRRAVCPGCAARRIGLDPAQAQEPWQCEGCGAVFLPSGVEQEAQVRAA
jgi:hypothetical protein